MSQSAFTQWAADDCRWFLKMKRTKREWYPGIGGWEFSFLMYLTTKPFLAHLRFHLLPVHSNWVTEYQKHSGMKGCLVPLLEKEPKPWRQTCENTFGQATACKIRNLMVCGESLNTLPKICLCRVWFACRGDKSAKT